MAVDGAAYYEFWVGFSKAGNMMLARLRQVGEAEKLVDWTVGNTASCVYLVLIHIPSAAENAAVYDLDGRVVRENKALRNILIPDWRVGHVVWRRMPREWRSPRFFELSIGRCAAARWCLGP